MYLAIDIGGTKTLVALFSRRGRVLKRQKFKTPHGSKVFLENLTTTLKSFRKFKIRAVVVAVPGIVQKNYTVKFGNRNWDNLDILTPIKTLFECPIYFENDANLAALFEGFGLTGRTIFLTFSTGVGGGIVEKNRILPESMSFEPGHKMYWYGGKIKEWEDVASTTAIENYYHTDQFSDLRKKEILEDIAKRVYLGLPDIVNTYHPDTVVLGGPLGKIFKLYVKYLPDDLKVKYRQPKRPTESVIYGCYIYARQKERE